MKSTKSLERTTQLFLEIGLKNRFNHISYICLVFPSLGLLKALGTCLCGHCKIISHSHFTVCVLFKMGQKCSCPWDVSCLARVGLVCASSFKGFGWNPLSYSSVEMAGPHFPIFTLNTDRIRKFAIMKKNAAAGQSPMQSRSVNLELSIPS